MLEEDMMHHPELYNNWIDYDFPGGGNILIFNNNPNELNDGGNSEVIEIIPPLNENGFYYIDSGLNIWVYLIIVPLIISLKKKLVDLLYLII